MLLALLALSLSPPLEYSAEHLEVSDDGALKARQLELRAPGFYLGAAAAEGTPSPTCRTDLRLEGPLSLRLRGNTATATGARVCLKTGHAHIEGLSLRGPRLHLDAELARLEDGAVQAEAVRVTTCACEDPPWSITTTSVSATLGQGAWLAWPVLWAGPVPVAAAPTWYIPFARRRTGLLLPQLGWDGEDGPFGALPFFWAPHQSVDATLAPGYRHGHGATGALELRWAADERERGHLELELLDEGLAASGDGSLPFGPTRLGLEGALYSTASVQQTLRRGLPRRQAHQIGAAGLSLTSARVAGGLRALTLQDLEAGGDLLSARDGFQPLPEAWFGWTAAWGPASLALDAQASHLVSSAESDLQVFDLSLAATGVRWLGPLRVQPAGGIVSSVQSGAARGGQQLTGYLAGELSVGLGRAFTALRHELHLIADGRLAEAALTAGTPQALRPRDRPRDSRAARLTLSNRLIAPGLSARLDATAGYEGAAPVGGVDRLWLRADAQTRWVGAEGSLAGASGWADLRLAPLAGPHLTLGGARVDPEGGSPWLRTRGLGAHWLLDAADVDSTVATGRLVLPLGRLRAEYGAFLDLEAGALAGQDGRLTWAGRCDCWGASLRASHERGRDLPDVWVSLQL